MVVFPVTSIHGIPLKFRNRFRSTAEQLKRDRCVGSDVADKFR